MLAAGHGSGHPSKSPVQGPLHSEKGIRYMLPFFRPRWTVGRKRSRRRLRRPQRLRWDQLGFAEMLLLPVNAGQAVSAFHSGDREVRRRQVARGAFGSSISAKDEDDARIRLRKIQVALSSVAPPLHLKPRGEDSGEASLRDSCLAWPGGIFQSPQGGCTQFGKKPLLTSCFFHLGQGLGLGHQCHFQRGFRPGRFNHLG